MRHYPILASLARAKEQHELLAAEAGQGGVVPPALLQIKPVSDL